MFTIKLNSSPERDWSATSVADNGISPGFTYSVFEVKDFLNVFKLEQF